MRPARRQDCRTIAELYSISSDGVANYIWTKLAAPGEDIVDVGARRYEQEDSNFSYRNCIIAELDGSAAGMLVAFPMIVDPAHVEEDPVLVPYSRLEEDGSYYICGMAVFPEYRGRGVGRHMLARAERDARTQDYTVLSLVVFEQNEGAKRLYERNGFVEVARAPVIPHPLIRHVGDALLMVKRIG